MGLKNSSQFLAVFETKTSRKLNLVLNFLINFFSLHRSNMELCSPLLHAFICNAERMRR